MDGGADDSVVTIWDGYVESYQFVSGSDHVTVTVRQGAGNAVTGTIYLGPQPPLPAPTDPNNGWPINPDDAAMPPVDSIEQFAFSLTGASLVNDRLTFKLFSGEIYKQWCEIQTQIFPYRQGGDPDGSVLTIACPTVPKAAAKARPPGAAAFGMLAMERETIPSLARKWNYATLERAYARQRTARAIRQTA